MTNNPSREHRWKKLFKKRDDGPADPTPPSSFGAGALPERPKAGSADPVKPDVDLWEQGYTKLKDDPETEKLMNAYLEILKSESNSLSLALTECFRVIRGSHLAAEVRYQIYHLWW